MMIEHITLYKYSHPDTVLSREQKILNNSHGKREQTLLLLISGVEPAFCALLLQGC